jgi:hypothetical protein
MEWSSGTCDGHDVMNKLVTSGTIMWIECDIYNTMIYIYIYIYMYSQLLETHMYLLYIYIDNYIYLYASMVCNQHLPQTRPSTNTFFWSTRECVCMTQFFAAQGSGGSILCWWHHDHQLLIYMI